MQDSIRLIIFTTIAVVLAWFVVASIDTHLFLNTNADPVAWGIIPMSRTDIGNQCGDEYQNSNVMVNFKLNTSNQIVYLCPRGLSPIRSTVVAKSISDNFRKSLTSIQLARVNAAYPPEQLVPAINPAQQPAQAINPAQQQPAQVINPAQQPPTQVINPAQQQPTTGENVNPVPPTQAAPPMNQVPPVDRPPESMTPEPSDATSPGTNQATPSPSVQTESVPQRAVMPNTNAPPLQPVLPNVVISPPTSQPQNP
jgi:hypothetical protein